MKFVSKGASVVQFMFDAWTMMMTGFGEIRMYKDKPIIRWSIWL